MSHTNPKAKRILFYTSLILNVVFLVGWLFSYKDDLAKAKPADFPYLSPRIFSENQNDLLINFSSLRDKLRNFVDQNKDDLGLYFEYLPTGTSIGINEKTEHRFASLLKVPLVMAYYLQTAQEKTPFDQTFVISENQLDDGYGDLWKKGAGTRLTTKELLNEILTKSDNTATNALADIIKKEYVQYVFNNLDIVLDRDKNNIQTISPKKYASIYKALYLSSILPKNESNEILNVLAQSVSKDTIDAGVPQDIRVANKIGEIINELYWDCGIIYEPKRPYSLCVFTTSTDTTGKSKIKEISKIIYDYIHNTNNQ